MKDRNQHMETAADVLRQPYKRTVVPQEDGTFLAEMVEFPGCIAIGESYGEALESLEEVAIDWVEAALEMGQSIPQPLEASEYSGKLVVRLPKSLHKKAALAAKLENTSLNQYIVACVASGPASDNFAQKSVPSRSAVKVGVIAQSDKKYVITGHNAWTSIALEPSTSAIPPVSQSSFGSARLQNIDWLKTQRSKETH